MNARFSAVLTEGHRLNRSIENQLDMTRLGHGTLKLQRDWVALADVVAAALDRIRKLYTSVKIVRDIPQELPLLHAHPALIEQAVVNITENLRTPYLQRGKSVLPHDRSKGSYSSPLATKGIPGEHREHVFDS